MMYEGIHTALITPFRDGRVDEKALRAMIEIQVEAGVAGVVPCGSTGESATLSHAEHRQVVELVVDAVNGRVAVIAGAGSNSTREAIEFTAHARDAGAEAALLLSPYYNKPTQEGIYAHYKAIAEETNFPIFIYNVPGRTSSNIAPETVVRLANLPGIVGIKEACGDIDQIAHIIAHAPDDFVVLSGDDALTLPLMAIGGSGVISTSSNVAPKQMVALVRSFMNGKMDRSREIHYSLLPLFDALFCETNPIPVKAACAALGWCDGEIRLPLTPIDGPNLEQLKLVMKDLGIL